MTYESYMMDHGSNNQIIQRAKVMGHTLKLFIK